MPLHIEAMQMVTIHLFLCWLLYETVVFLNSNSIVCTIFLLCFGWRFLLALNIHMSLCIFKRCPPSVTEGVMTSLCDPRTVTCYEGHSNLTAIAPSPHHCWCSNFLCLQCRLIPDKAQADVCNPALRASDCPIGPSCCQVPVYMRCTIYAGRQAKQISCSLPDWGHLDRILNFAHRPTR